jgi:hypothetical protein
MLSKLSPFMISLMLQVYYLHRDMCLHTTCLWVEKYMINSDMLQVNIYVIED